MSDIEQEISEAVDQFVDSLDESRVEEEAERLGIGTDELLDRIKVEAKTRIDGAV